MTVLLRNLRTFKSLSNRSFRLYSANNLLSMAAVNMQGMARSLLIYRLTKSPAILGVANVGFLLPVLLLSPIGGLLADRMKKKYLVIAGQIEGALPGLVVAVFLSTGYLSTEHPSSWWVVMLAYVIDGIGIGLTGPSFQAMIREIVGAEQTMNAVAINNLGSNILRVVGPLVAGVIVAVSGFATLFYVVAALILAGNFFLIFLPAISPQITAAARRPLANIREGFTYVRRDPTLMLVLGFLMLVVLLSMPYGALMPVFSDSILKVGAEGLGFLISVSGVGATLVSVIIASLPNKRRGPMLLAGALLLAVTLVGFSFSTLWELSLVLIFFVGLGDAVRMTVGTAVLLYYSDQSYWGRVMSLQSMQWGLSGLGALFAGLLAQEVGAQWAVGGFAAVLVVVTVLTWAFVPRLRRLD